MTRQQYREARRLIRDNGLYALRWMKGEQFAAMDALVTIQASEDYLAERADIVAYCQREGLACTVRHTGRTH